MKKRGSRPFGAGRLVDDELHHHIESKIERYVARGMAEEDARRLVVAEFGDPEAIRDELLAIDAPGPEGSFGSGILDALRQDVSIALRRLRRSPGFATAAILTLGLGIGAASAIFGIVNAVVLDPLPFPDPERLVQLNQTAPDGRRFTVSNPDLEDFRTGVTGLEALAGMYRADLALQRNGEPVSLVAQMVTGDFFRVFQTAPVSGRVFGASSVGPDPERVVVLSHRAARSLFEGPDQAVQSTLRLDDIPFEVIGVMPSGWEPMARADLWIPMLHHPLHMDRQDHDLDAVGRIAGHASVGAVDREAKDVAARLGREHPSTNERWSVQLTPLREAYLGADRIRGGWLLLGTVALLLLLACASVATLLLAKASERGREMGVRAALGAGRGRLIRQLVTESLVLSLLGGALGVILAFVGVPLLQAVAPENTPRIADAAVDLEVIFFAGTASLVTGLLFGLAPIGHVARRAPAAVLGAGTRGAVGSGEERFTGTLVAFQIALAVALLSGSGLLAMSFLEARSLDTGMAVDEIVVVPLMLSGDRYTVAERAVAQEEIQRAIESIPGVAAVGSSNIGPLSGGNTTIDLAVEGRPGSAGEAPFARWRSVTRSYFDAAGLDVLHGRTFESFDVADDAESVVVFTETLARRTFGAPESAVGARIAMGWNGTNWRRVVGVVSDLEDVAIQPQTPSVFFFPEQGGWPWSNLVVRLAAADLAVPAREIREAIWEVDSGLPVPIVERLSGRTEEAVAGRGFNLLLVSVFGGVALTLAMLGIYGVTLHSVTSRTREIGVRIALGARAERVARRIIGRGARMVAAGIAGGLGLSFLFARWLQGLLFRGSGVDWRILGCSAAFVAVTAMVSLWLPSRRAARVDPCRALAAD